MISIADSIFSTIRKKIRRLTLKNYKICPGIYLDISSMNFEEIFIDLTCKRTCKLGDSFFYIEALKKFLPILLKKYKVTIGTNELNYSLLNNLIKENVVISKNSKISHNHFYISSIGNSNGIKSRKNFLIIDPHLYDYNKKINCHILYAFDCLVERIVNTNASCNKSYILVSLDLGSQKFRSNSKKRNEVLRIAEMYAEEFNYKLIILTSIDLNSRHLKIDPKLLTFDKFKSLVNCDNCKAIFTFDSFIMHFSAYCNKKVFAKFRGKYTNKSYIGHFNYINNAFSEKIIYI